MLSLKGNREGKISMEADRHKRKLEEMEITEKVSRYFISKFLTGYIFIVSLIMFYELVMIVRGLFVFDFTYWRHILYFISYIILLLASIPPLVILGISSSRKKILDSVSIASTSYAVILVLWATVISYLDMMGHHTFIVYMTVSMGVGSLLAINPRVYIKAVVPTSMFLLFMAYYWNSDLVHTSGYIFNYMVFVSMSIMISIRQFSMTKREYLDRNKLEEMSFHDTLTGLKNRNALMNELDSFSSEFAFGVIDIDDFKVLNDNHGHDYGDHCLKVVGKSLKNNFGENVYRFGGDEFIIVTPISSEDEIRRAFDKVNDILYVRFQNRDISVSGGFFISHSQNMSFDAYFKHADRALYKSKTNGKCQVSIES